MSPTIRYIIALLLFVAVAAPVSRGDDTLRPDTVSNLTGVEIKTSVDRSESFIGDLINYTVGITYDSAFELIPPPLGVNLGGFEVKDYVPDKQSVLEDGRLYSETRFVLSAYVVGEYLIPPLPVQFMAPDSTRKIML